MGAADFCVMKRGIYKDAKEAFYEAVEDAQYDNGHSGYTGTIAEKGSFRMVEVPNRKDPNIFLNECITNSEDKFWDDKWGDAACIEATGVYLKRLRPEHYKGKRNFHVYWFFGVASE